MKATSETDSKNMSDNEKRFRELVLKYSNRDLPNYWMYSFHEFFSKEDGYLIKFDVNWFEWHYHDVNVDDWYEYQYCGLDDLLDPNHPYNKLPDGRTLYQYLKEIDFNVNLDFESSVKYN